MNNSDDCAAPPDLTAADAAARTRLRAVRRVFIITLFFNAAVALAKASYGWISHSLSVGTDSLHSILDASANVLALLGLHWAAAPADARHPYGRRKIEIVAALGIGVLIVIGMFELATAAIGSLRGHSPPPTIGNAGFVIMLSTIVVNVFVTRYEARKARELGSALLRADASHTQSDVYASLAVVASFVAVRAGFAWADGAAALIVVALVSHVAWEVFSENVPVLIDRAVLDAAQVADCAQALPGVDGVHRVRSRGLRHAVELDLHLRVAGAMTVSEAHAVAREVEAQLRVKFPEVSDVVIHVEPPPSSSADDFSAKKSPQG